MNLKEINSEKLKFKKFDFKKLIFKVGITKFLAGLAGFTLYIFLIINQ